MDRMRIKVEPERMAKLLEDSGWEVAVGVGDLAVLSQKFWLETAPDGEMLFRENDRDAFMGIVIDGEVEILRADSAGEDQLIATLGPGVVFGEMSLLDGEPRSASARAKGDFSMLVLTEEDFEQLVVGHPRLGLSVVRSAARHVSLRLRQMDAALVDFLD